MNWADWLKSLIPRFDPRSSKQVEADLDDEFEFHIRRSTKQLVEDGSSDEVGRAEAQLRFGDVKRIKSQCKHIALQERIMLQRINLALMIVVLLVVAIVSFQMYTTQKDNTLALQTIVDDLVVIKLTSAEDDRSSENLNAQLVASRLDAQEQQARVKTYQKKIDQIIQENPPAKKMYDMFGQVLNRTTRKIVEKLELDTEETQALKDILNDMNMRMKAGKNSPFHVGFVYLDGQISRPGTYVLPQIGRLTLSRLLASSGGVTGVVMRVKVVRSVTGEDVIVFDQTIGQISDIGEADIVLMGDDIVTVDIVDEISNPTAPTNNSSS